MKAVQKIVAANAALVLYYMMPNITSFLLALALILILVCPDCLVKSANCCQGCSCSVNDLFNNYLEMPHTRSIYHIMKSCWW